MKKEGEKKKPERNMLKIADQKLTSKGKEEETHAALMRKEVRYVGQNKQLGEAARGKGKHHPH
jgi:hypothetical protein